MEQKMAWYDESFNNILNNMMKALRASDYPRYQKADILVDVQTIYKERITTFIWCLRESGTFIYPITGKNLGNHDNDAYGMELHKKADFFVVFDDKARNSTEILNCCKPITYDEAMWLISENERIKK